MSKKWLAKQWDQASKPALVGFVVGVLAFLVLVWRSPPGNVFLVDAANLLFHEASHVVVGLFSQRLEPYGGTLGQLTFPVILAVSFWRKNQAIPFAVAVLWFFQNFLGIAHYMADARALALPLVGGGEHDWNNIFFRWHVLSYDTQIARVVRIVGWVGMIAASLWGVFRGYRNLACRSEPSEWNHRTG